MSNSPFELFRRNLKPLMVFLTGLALFAFVVLPVLDTYMRRNAGTMGSEVVATFGDSQLTRSRVEYFTRNHLSTVRFLEELALETIRRGGAPQTAGFSYDDQTQRVNSLGINQVPSFMGTIRSLMLAAQAQKEGFELDDNTLQVWLQQYTNGMITDRDINAMLMRSTQNQMGRPHLYEQLRTHLLARVYEQRGLTGMFLGQSPMTGPLMTPQEQWQNFLKLNRNAVTSAYGVLVSDYLPQTNATPSEIEIKAVYDEGKDRDPDDQSPDPAFHRRYTAKIEYVSGDLQSFVDAEVAKLSEEEIRAEYEKRLKGGEFQLPDTPPAAEAPSTDQEAPSTDQEAPAEPAEATETEPASDSSATPESSEPSPAEESPTEEASPEPAATEPESASSESASSDSDSTEPSEPAGSEAETPEDSSPAEEPAAEESDESADSADQSSTRSPSTLSAVRLVTTQQEQDAEQAGAGEGESAGADQAPPAASETETATSTEASEAEPAQEPQAADSSAAQDPAPSTDEPAAETDAPAEAAPAENAAENAPEGEAKPEEDSAPKVEAFEDVRQQIAEEMVFDVAREKMETAMAAIANRMRRYFSENSMYQTSLTLGEANTAAAPQKPDLAKLAQEQGLQYEVIGPYSVATIRDEPIALSVSMDMGSQFMGQSTNFVQLMYGTSGEQSDSPTQPLFAPVRTIDSRNAKQYVAWKIDETPAYTPSLDEVRDEVVMAIRTKEARKLAREAAEAIVAQVKQGEGKSLRDAIPQDKLDNFKEGLGPFTWMNSFGFAGATIGNVPELDSVGDAFMKAVFENEPGELKIAENQPGRVIYIVQPEAFQPSIEELRNQFKQPTNRLMAMLLGNGANSIINDFFEGLDEKANFQDLTGAPTP